MAEAPTPQRVFESKDVAITGRMASMSRAEAMARIDMAGGRYVGQVNGSTHVLVVGLEGWPLSRDGRLTKALQKAQELHEQGAAIEVLREDEFLNRLGMGDGEGVRRLYTIEQLSRILSVSRVTLRQWMRAGLIQAKKTVHHLCYFDFEQVASAKVLNDLRNRGVGAAEIHHSLHQLKRWFPGAEKSIAQLGVLEQGGHLLVRLEGGQLAEPSGQLFFDFADTDEVDPETGERPRITRDWFEVAVQHEEAGELEDAVDAYQEALLSGGPQAEIAFNLGNALYALGRRDAAAHRFMQAVEIDASYVEAWNNLGNTLCELGYSQQGMRAYSRALDVEPRYADAHFNLAETLEQLGHADQAREHWQAYLNLDPNSSWARRVRERLEGKSGPPERKK